MKSANSLTGDAYQINRGMNSVRRVTWGPLDKFGFGPSGPLISPPSHSRKFSEVLCKDYNVRVVSMGSKQEVIFSSFVTNKLLSVSLLCAADAARAKKSTHFSLKTWDP